jgi:hypothetical protein
MLAAFVSAMLAGLLVDLLGKADETAGADNAITSRDSDTEVKNVSSCCSSGDAPLEASKTFASRVRSALSYGFGSMIDDLARPLVFGFLLAGLVSANIPEDFFLNHQFSPLLSMILVLLVSLPVYVCSTSSTPLAAALVAKGLYPGAAVVFLLAGPATNIATVLVLRQELGNRACIAYLGSVVFVALAVGYLMPGDWIVAGADALMHDHGAAVFDILAAAVLFLLLLGGLLRKSAVYRRVISGKRGSSQASLDSCCS